MEHKHLRDRRIAFVGAGGMGGYIGGRMAQHGLDVTLIDPWGAHVDAIKRQGLRLDDPQGSAITHPKALHLHEVQALFARPIEVAFVSVKSYDTEWATLLIRDYLAPGGYVVSLQNGINEERIARHVGWGRTLGCIASTIGVSVVAPGHVARAYQPGGAAYTVFRVGEVHGRITQRARDVAAMLDLVDSSMVTTDLWGERWSKLAANSMHNGLSAVTGLGHTGIYGDALPRRIAISLGAEAIKVGRALGFMVDTVRGLSADALVAAGAGDAQALCAVEAQIEGWFDRLTDEARPSTGQDMLKGRRTEIDAINGLVVEKAEELHMTVPLQSAMVALVKRVERGEIAPSPANVEILQRAA